MIKKSLIFLSLIVILLTACQSAQTTNGEQSGEPFELYLVADEEIQEVVQSLPLDQAPDRLISLANTRGGHDNTTIILLRAPKVVRRFSALGGKKRFVLGCIIALAILSALVVAAFFGLRWWLGTGDQASPPAVPTETITHQVDAPAETLPVAPKAIPTKTMTPEEQDGLPAPATRTPWPTHTTRP